ncbi:flagellar hook-basal body complex protein FliE [Arcobacter sp. F2176]|uniref:flagellar hook-basal body complex protein FliE n=1 Tax=unclassified Arcobacter TaxID=2593671 RepID=UPI00100B2D52|nr:flagellar hook-basal body complex protein FliE [Arcobacter sp. F2176]RXJ80055.1 flagellar hook-basal body complex protein FliE [Arcobacter sp. F2176]|eukprot:TRINITY_DN641_c0_g1_i6.p11 TRINITY_DN641_c0_g1~~TRINITY_DN641_c0_g1_i6.p11  ORF type:complete len:101 (+),score=4.51 TRINITY_DN641_c0_g1_i6:6251-6553(+)
MDISGINGISNVFNKNNVQKTNETENQGESFASMLKNAVNEVNNTQVDGYKAMENIATGKVENLQEAVSKIEEAELTLKLALEVKNKAMAGFKQVMAMQV